MNLVQHPLDPSLQTICSAPPPVDVDKPLDSRELFYKFIHSGEQPNTLALASLYLTQQVLIIQQHYQSRYSLKYQVDYLKQLALPSQPDSVTTLISSNLIDDYAPLILTELCWLPAVSQVATSQTLEAIQLTAIYAKLHNTHYLAQLNAHLLNAKLPALHTWAFSQQVNFPDAIFNFATLQLAFAKQSRVFFPELLGFTLACFKALCLNPAQWVVDNTTAAFLTTRQYQLNAQIPALIDVITHYFYSFPEHIDNLWLRLQNGYYLYQHQAEHCLQHKTPEQLSVQQTLAKLLQRLAPHAVGHHGKINLAGKKLDAWFQQSPFDSTGFLQALRQSPYINKSNPEQSLLLPLFDFNGPMFGVLNSDEKALLKTWLLSDNSIESIAHNTEKRIEPIFKTMQSTTEAIDYNNLSRRELYYYLNNADLYPGIIESAKTHVARVLYQTKLFSHLPFNHYSHQAFAHYMHSIYQQEVASYQPLSQSPRLSKQAYLWGIEQFAPTILTDGCWLQHSKQLSFFSNHAIGDILYKIYDDETGNGILVQNHPYIYQQLLESIGLHLPPIHSKTFSEDQRFINSAFDIPNYLMAISKFPSTFLPELLGLNMAIEISGLGKVYLRLAEELEFYGLNSAIVKVHISIDNLATGHSALAIKAIQLYMDDLLANHGENAVQQHWRRIYTGYCSLQSVSRLFKYSLVLNYWLKHKRGFKE